MITDLLEEIYGFLATDSGQSEISPTLKTGMVRVGFDGLVKFVSLTADDTREDLTSRHFRVPNHLRG